MASREEAQLWLNVVLEQLDKVENLVNFDSQEDSTSHSDCVKAASQKVSLAYTMETLLYLYLRMTADEWPDHPIHKDLERVKSYVDKVRQAQGKVKKQVQVRINTDAAERFIRNALWEVPSENVELPADGEELTTIEKQEC